MPVGLDIQLSNLKSLERAWKKDIRTIQHVLDREAEGVGKMLERDVKNLVRADLLSHGYGSDIIDEILDGITVLQYKAKGARLYARIKVTLVGGGWANAHLGEHTDREQRTTGKSTGRLKPDKLNLDVFLDRTAPQFAEAVEKIAARILDLKQPI